MRERKRRIRRDENAASRFVRGVAGAAAIALTAALSGCGLGGGDDGVVTLIYTGNLNGELEPCGCAEESDLGGLLRRFTAIREFRKTSNESILVSSGGILAVNAPRDRLKSEYIIEGMRAMGFDAVGVQWRDLAYGAEFIASFDFPWVSTHHGGRFRDSGTVRKGDHSFSIFSWLDPSESPLPAEEAAPGDAGVHVEALRAAVAEAKDAGNRVILLSASLSADAAQALPLENVDILIHAAEDEKYREPEWVGDTLVLRPGRRGMYIGRLDMSFDELGGIEIRKHDVVKLDRSIDDAPELASWYREYNDAVKQAFLSRVAEQRSFAEGQSEFVGVEVCRACHAAEYETWKQSKHARAYNTLENVGKGFDPDCIGCHTVGFEAGGFIDPVVSPHLLHVQCESCHGAGREHVSTGGGTWMPALGSDGEPPCASCHFGSHSPAFDHAVYWPKIAH